MPTTLSKPVDAKMIADMPDRGEGVSMHFTSQFTVVREALDRRYLAQRARQAS
jgi:hypothetical protein